MTKVSILIALVSSTLSFTAQAQLSVSSSAGIAVGGYNVNAADYMANLKGFKAHNLTDEEKKQASEKFKLKSDDKVAFVGAYYELKDNQGGSEEGYNWVKAVPNPTSETVFEAAGAVDESAMNFANEAVQKYMAKASGGKNMVPMPSSGNGSGGQIQMRPVEKPLRADLKLEFIVIGSSGCPVCVRLDPILEDLKKDAEIGAHVTITKMQYGSSEAYRYNATSLPTMILKYNGKVVDKVDGSMGETTGMYLKQKLRQYN